MRAGSTKLSDRLSALETRHQQIHKRQPTKAERDQAYRDHYTNPANSLESDLARLRDEGPAEHISVEQCEWVIRAGWRLHADEKNA